MLHAFYAWGTLSTSQTASFLYYFLFIFFSFKKSFLFYFLSFYSCSVKWIFCMDNIHIQSQLGVGLQWCVYFHDFSLPMVMYSEPCVTGATNTCNLIKPCLAGWSLHLRCTCSFALITWNPIWCWHGNTKYQVVSFCVYIYLPRCVTGVCAGSFLEVQVMALQIQ